MISIRYMYSNNAFLFLSLQVNILSASTLRYFLAQPINEIFDTGSQSTCIIVAMTSRCWGLNGNVLEMTSEYVTCSVKISVIIYIIPVIYKFIALSYLYVR